MKADADPAAHYGRLAELGYGAVEMAGPSHYTMIKEAGLELLNLCAAGMSGGLNQAEHHAALLPEIRQSIQHAGQNGIAQLIVFSGDRGDMDDAAGVDNCISGLKQLVGDAEAAGVTLTFEMLNENDHPGYHAVTSRFGFDVVRGVDSPVVRALYDIYHMVRSGEDPIETLVPNIDLVAHLHVAGSPGRDFPGADQDIDYGTIVREVQAAGYQGYWGMEFMPQRDGLEELAETAERFRSFLGS